MSNCILGQGDNQFTISTRHIWKPKAKIKTLFIDPHVVLPSVCVCVSECVCMCVFEYVCGYLGVCVCGCMLVGVCVCISMCLGVRVCMCVYVGRRC